MLNNKLYNIYRRIIEKFLRVEGYRFEEKIDEDVWNVKVSGCPPQAFIKNEFRNVKKLYSFLPGRHRRKKRKGELD